MIPLRYTLGGRRHISPDSLTGWDVFLLVLPDFIARYIFALKLLRHYKLVPDRPAWRLWLRRFWPYRATWEGLLPGDITFEWPMGSSRVWEVMDTRARVRPFHRSGT